MSTFDWRDNVNVNLMVLKFFGLWPPDYEVYKPDLYLLYFILVTIIIIGVHNLTQIVNIFYVYNDLEALSATVFVAATNIFSVVKRYFYIQNLKTIKNLFATLNTKFRPKNSYQEKLIQRSVTEWRRFYIIFHSIVIINISLWLLVPVINGWVKQHKLPFEAWYPFKTDGFPNYELTYAFQFVCIWYLGLCNLNVDTLIYAFMMFIGCQCDILADDLKNLDKNFGTELINCVKYHKMILRFAEDTNNIFSIIIFGQMVASTGGLALTMFQLSVVGISGPALPNIVYIVGMSAEIFLYCWFGNEIQLKSRNISFAVYESNWIGQPVPALRSLMILSERCQRPAKMTAMNLFTFSLETFIAIMKSAWSYFAVLSTVNSK